MTTSAMQSIWGSWVAGLRCYHRALLVALWGGVQGACWVYYRGPHFYGDGKSYLAYAQQLAATGTWAAGHYQRYAGYAAFIALFLQLNLGLLAVALAQVLLAGLAALAFYCVAWQLGQRCWLSATLATAAWIGWVPAQAFTAFILTESIFTSGLVLCLWALVHWPAKHYVLLLLGLLLYLATVRPNGCIALAAAALAGLWWLWRQHQHTWAGLGLLLWLLLAAVGLNSVSEPFHLLDNYALGTVIFNYGPANILPPPTLRLPADGNWPLFRLGWFVAHNPGYFCQLCAAKATYFLGYPRPWYSSLHRVIVLLVLPLLYGLAAVGATRRWVAAPVRVYLGATILFQLSIVMLTTEDWDNRFSAPLVAYWLQLAALGAQPWLRRWSRLPENCQQMK